jgi:hypothetical protein
LALGLFALALAGCSSNVLMKPDCHSCTVEEQEWKEFSWNGLLGRWKGSVETLRNIQGAKKVKAEKLAEVKFFSADEFLRATGATCKTLAPNALVLNGQLWEDGTTAREYEAFVPVEEDRVAYGRLTFTKVDGHDLCQFRRLGRVMGKNRLSLPSVSFSSRALADTAGRLPAQTTEQEVSFEFLRFAPFDKTAQVFQPDGRRPAAVPEQEQEQTPLADVPGFQGEQQARRRSRRVERHRGVYLPALEGGVDIWAQRLIGGGGPNFCEPEPLTSKVTVAALLIKRSLRFPLWKNSRNSWRKPAYRRKGRA